MPPVDLALESAWPLSLAVVDFAESSWSASWREPWTHPSIGTSLLGILAISGSPCPPYIVLFETMSPCVALVGLELVTFLPQTECTTTHRSYNPSLSFLTYIMELYS